MSVNARSCSARDDVCWTDRSAFEANDNIAALNSDNHPDANLAALISTSQAEGQSFLRRRHKTVSGDAEANRTDSRQLQKSSGRHQAACWDDWNDSRWHYYKLHSWHVYKWQNWRDSPCWKHTGKHALDAWQKKTNEQAGSLTVPGCARGSPKRAKWLGPGPSGVLIPEEPAEIDVEVQLNVTLKVKNGTMTINDLAEKALGVCGRICLTEWPLQPTRYRLKGCEWKDPWDDALYWSPKTDAARSFQFWA